jgi:hypothetical protein
MEVGEWNHNVEIGWQLTANTNHQDHKKTNALFGLFIFAK